MTIETVEHHNGSKGHGLYWGYIVGCDNGRTKVFHGRDGSSEKKGLHLKPFTTQAEATQFAETLNSHMEAVLESQLFGNPRNLPGPPDAK